MRRNRRQQLVTLIGQMVDDIGQPVGDDPLTAVHDLLHLLDRYRFELYNLLPKEEKEVV